MKMGMFDYFKCSADIGELTNVDCQTKDIFDDVCGTMSFYWVDPSGMLWYPDYAGTQDFVENPNEDAPIWLQYHMESNGNKGRVVRSYLTKTIEIYTSRTQPDGIVDFDTCTLIFSAGILQGGSYK